jgi:hypothetical protein
MVAASLKRGKSRPARRSTNRLGVSVNFTLLIGRSVKRFAGMVHGRLGWVSGATLSQAR